MPYRLDKIFKPITANPPQNNCYIEIAPCDALKPYIRCFWISKNNSEGKSSLVIPDLCMDIILNFDGNTIYNNFCGVADKAFVSEDSKSFIFGIRFYAWSVVLFCDDDLNNVLNSFVNTREYFCDFNECISEEIISVKRIYKMKLISERYLLSKLNPYRLNNDVMNALYRIIKSGGNIKIDDLSNYCVISKRQLDRNFLKYTGVTPKKMANLIRYQLLWQDSIKDEFDVFDSIEKYGYYDQSHLLNEFKRYHSVSLSKARENYFTMTHFYNTI